MLHYWVYYIYIYICQLYEVYVKELSLLFFSRVTVLIASFSKNKTQDKPVV